jgi:negative regulator of sigma-B (phosphoserine phosphatase)
MEIEGPTRVSFLEWGIAGRPMPGESESGDEFIVHPRPGGALLAVIDALGHGPAAASAARIAAACLRAHAHAPLGALMNLCHDALRQTHGVVVSVASFDSASRTLGWIGVGNVECVLIRGDALARPQRVFLVPRGGVVGYQLPPVRASDVPIAECDTVVFATDGIRHGFLDHLVPTDAP